MAFIRKSKFRHVFGTIAKRDACFEGMKATTLVLDSNLLKVNDKFISYIYESGSGSGGGAVVVLPITQTGRQANDLPLISGHRNRVTDLDWCPSNSNLLATGSEDSYVRVWTIPEGGLTLPGISDGAIELVGHGRKVLETIWNPNASGVLASSSVDETIKIWDVQNKKAVIDFESEHHDALQSFVWNDEGKLIVSACKDKKIRILDVRAKKVVLSTDSHPGAKPAQVVLNNQKNWILSTGFGKGSDRQLLAWDVRNIAKPLSQLIIDQSSGVMLPFFDEGTQILYVASKGEALIRYYETTLEKPYLFYLNNFSEGIPTRGITPLPKILVDAAHNETYKFYRLTAKDTVEPISFTVPRKSDAFQLDIYPPTPDTSTPGVTADEYFAGSNKTQRLKVYDSEGKVSYSNAPMQREEIGVLESWDTPSATPVVSSSSQISKEEKDAIHIKELEVRLEELTRLDTLEKELAQKQVNVERLKQKLADLTDDW